MDKVEHVDLLDLPDEFDAKSSTVLTHLQEDTSARRTCFVNHALASRFSFTL